VVGWWVQALDMLNERFYVKIIEMVSSIVLALGELSVSILVDIEDGFRV
jgi:hypothetical protein